MSTENDRPPTPAIRGIPEPRWVGLDLIVDVETFRLREIHDASPLAESLIRHGQREPVDLRRTAEGLQLLNGHRRLEAVRMLRRDRILARVHDDLSDEDAVFLAISDDLDRRPWSQAERAALRASLESRGALSPRVTALLDRAEAQALVEPIEPSEPEEEEEIDADLLAASVRDRLADACNDLAALHELWGDLDEGRRADLVECVGYLKDMYPFLAASEEEDP